MEQRESLNGKVAFSIRCEMNGTISYIHDQECRDELSNTLFCKIVGTQVAVYKNTKFGYNID